ncbi:spoIIIJ-associated protein [Salibacterium salarium]|uniref:RNA-binding cell elongation regulator Jag/EloR n=1 Tax=Salibacterium salarium TaxID=284579 RepID=UPI00278AD799|nr:RNA-binding cell elongation regulator Jag/EloR [Salibacterium salarium]MDQ0297630.1 spoIIIJ-associated protein [Salibacterium salarium]
MKTVKVSGKTVEAAITKALDELNATTKEDIDFKVVEEPSKGFLGIIGSREAVLEASLKIDPVAEGLHFLQQVIADMGVNVEVKTQETGKETILSLTGDDLGVMIGKRGKTLDSLQYLVNLAANRYTDRYYRIILDAEDYRKRRREALEQLADRLALKAKRTGEKVFLEPMVSRERKIIHAALQKNNDVQTYSDGTDPHRYVVIAPK